METDVKRKSWSRNKEGGKQGGQELGRLANVAKMRTLLTHADHHTFVAGATNNGGEDSARGVITSEAGLTHAGAVVNHESLDFVVSHGSDVLKLT